VTDLFSSSDTAIFFPRVAQFADRLRGLSFQRRGWLAFGLGVISALAFPPYNFTPLLWLCFPLLVWLVQGAETWWRAAVTGWSFAFGFLALGLYWIAASMFVDIGHFWWAVPLSVAGLPLFFAIDYGVMTAAAWKIGLRGPAGPVIFALCWFIADYGRGHLFTGFPWILVGYAWMPVLPMLQLTSLIGIYGLTLLTLIVVCLPSLMAGRRADIALVIAGCIGLLVCGAWGEVRLLQGKHGIGATYVPDVRIRLVQPNIEPAHKWDAADRDKNFQALLDMTSAPGTKPVTHVIWPETASTFRLSEDPYHRDRIAEHIPAAGAVLTGVIRRAVDDNGKVHVYNSLVAVDGRARIVAGYDKVHLVPYGEYFPYSEITHMRAIANLGMDFDHGDSARTLRVLGLPSFSPLICYEAVFSGDVAERDDRPHFLLNITNDGWYGHTAGPYQHFAIVRVRAIEEGMPLLRAANTGISGVVDAYGRVIARLGISKVGYLDSDLPEELPPTLFVRYGEKPLWALFGCFAVLAFWVRIYRRKS
jgi:apolipoprotein N-acyltransferase